ncbi:hypothetical protein KTO58_17240 [Chitinophaga pendula]|uniref:hypothetical protein n=1 Tax=Chitinophaga TaxID=79328 RepID=UPI000BB0C700|nr:MULTISPECIES: hypothetical protein [Chitinophaga]ASZ11555.1 hypothetical protein CK934_11600 [Chitinophaga sp. MD30]UCJ05435.1 hypothetical protein KTO58_17240 [Chitinophaga pendula]
MQAYSFMSTEELFLLQDALKKNKKQLTKFILIGIALLIVAAIIPQIYLYSNSETDEANESIFSYKNIWFWVWLLSFVVALIFALIKVTDIRYWAIKKDLMALQKGSIDVPLEAVYLENNDTQTNFMVLLENKRKRLFYWMRGALEGFRTGDQVEITYARHSRVILTIDKKR